MSFKVIIERSPWQPWGNVGKRKVDMPWAIAEALEHGLKKAEEKYGMSSPEAKEIRLMITDFV